MGCTYTNKCLKQIYKLWDYQPCFEIRSQEWSIKAFFVEERGSRAGAPMGSASMEGDDRDDEVDSLMARGTKKGKDLIVSSTPPAGDSPDGGTDSPSLPRSRLSTRNASSKYDFVKVKPLKFGKRRFGNGDFLLEFLLILIRWKCGSVIMRIITMCFRDFFSAGCWLLPRWLFAPLCCHFWILTTLENFWVSLIVIAMSFGVFWEIRSFMD